MMTGPGNTGTETKAAVAAPAKIRRLSAWWLLSVVPGYWVLSALFHGAVLAYLTWLAPVRELEVRERRSGLTAGSVKIARVMDLIRERQAELLQDRVRELADIQRELESIEARKQLEFSQFAAEFAQDAPGAAAQAQAAAAQAQAEALAAQGQAAEALARALQTGAKEDFGAVTSEQSKASEAQLKADAHLTKALEILQLGGVPLADARQAQAEVHAAQVKANQAQLSAAASREDTQWRSGDLTNKSVQAGKVTESLARAQAEVEAAGAKWDEGKRSAEQTKAEAAQARATADQARTVAAQARIAADQAKTDADQAKAGADQARAAGAKRHATADEKQAAQEQAAQAKAKAEQAREASTQAKGQADQAKDKAARAESEARQAQAKADAAQNRVAQQERALEQARQRLEQAHARAEQTASELAGVKARTSEAGDKATATQREAKTLQALALQSQEKARQALAAASTNFGVAAASLTNLFPESSATNLTGELSALDLADLYQAAVTIENNLTEEYRRIRATELSMIRRIPLAQAIKLTEVAKSVRPDLKAKLKEQVGTAEGAGEMREVVNAAATEINSMLSLGHSLLGLAKGLDAALAGSAGGASISLDGVNAKAAQAQAMAELAAEDTGARAKDLSGVMKAGAGGSGAGVAGQGRGQGTGAGGVPGAGMRGGRGGFGPSLEPPIWPKNLRALPARKVTRDGQPAEWLFVDSWYILGPFDNAGRANIDTKYPPETVVDLNATYLGKNNLPVRWEFYQAPTQTTEAGRITPRFSAYERELRRARPGAPDMLRQTEYIIYYAYTELYFDEPRDLWIAVGSDDYSKVWIEDQLVWSSGRLQKSWRVDEGYRKVHFKAGVNRILYRIENGWRGTDFSMVICLKQG